MSGKIDISFFCEDVIIAGDPVEHYNCNEPNLPPRVRKFRGGRFVGISLNTVVDIDYRFAVPKYNEVAIGSKIGIATSGTEVIMDIVGEAGDFIRPKKDGTWKVKCKRSKAVGVILSCDGNKSIVRLK